MYVNEMHQKDADQLLRVRKGSGRGRAGFSFHTSIHSLKDAGKYMKILANFQLLYEYHVLFFVLFCIFQNKNGGNGGNSAPVELL